MNPKVRDLVAAVREGFAISSIDEGLQGGVFIALLRGRERRDLRFAHYEVPAILQECRLVGVAK